MLERVIDQPLRIEHVLDPDGARVVVSARTEAGGRSFAIAHWHAGKQCALPADTAQVFDPLLPAEDQRSGLRGVRLPIARGDAEGALTLWLSDAECALQGPLAGIDPSSAHSFVSFSDRRSVLGFLDRDAALFLVDASADAAIPIAIDVRAWKVSALSADPVSDILWVTTGGRLTQYLLDGTLRVRLGDDVSAFAVYDSLNPRVAYVDGGDLYEASAPGYVPTLRAEGACAPVYSKTALDLYLPCAAQQLVRVSIGPGELTQFDDGVYASRSIGPLRFDYQHGAAEDALYVEGPELARQRIEPLLEPDSLRVLGGDRVAGWTADGKFGIWTIAEQTFEPLFTHIETAIPVADASTDDEIMLFHHDVGEDGTGTLSTFRLGDLAPNTIARGVPRRAAAGFALDAGQYFPNFPANAPVLVYIKDAVLSGEDRSALKGRLRVELLSGEFGTDLTDEVSSYAFATQPLPGLIVASEDGPRAGLWFAAL